MQSQMTQKKKLAVSLAIVVISVVIDQLTKYWAAVSLRGGPGYNFLWNTTRLTYTENTGAFLSLGAAFEQSTRTLLFTVGVLVIIGMCIYWLVRSAHTWITVVALAAVISGGIGNLIDRIWRGSVIDFIYMDLGGPLHTGVFNVADMAITGGLVVMLYDQYVLEKRKTAT